MRCSPTATSTLLLVDDDQRMLELLHEYFGEQGYHVRLALTGVTALRQLEAEPADLVVLDLGLPDVDGLEVCRRIRDRGDHTWILVLSAREGENDKVAALRVGADDYLTKPFGLAELAARVRVALRHTASSRNGQATDRGRA
jgi:DNA-binding response OmpR family regulator